MMRKQAFQPHGVDPFADVPFLVVEDDPASAPLTAAVRLIISRQPPPTGPVSRRRLRPF